MGSPSGSSIKKSNINSTKGKIRVEYLPAYAPELNPVEYLWCRWKKFVMGNYCSDSIDELYNKSKVTLKRLKRNSDKVAGLWRQAHLI